MFEPESGILSARKAVQAVAGVAIKNPVLSFYKTP